MERDELDKIKVFSKRLDQSLQQALHVHVAIDRRLKNFQHQKNIVEKEVLHQRFRHPKTTIEVTHPFPLKVPLVDEVVSEEGGAESSLDVDRKVDQLMTDIADYNKAPKMDRQLDGMMATDEPNISEDLNQSQSVESAIERKGSVSTPDSDAPDGVSLRDEFEDQSLYIKRKKSEDVMRSKAASDKVDEDPALPRDDQADADAPLTDKERKGRIWDYIDQDKTSGGISHDI